MRVYIVVCLLCFLVCQGQGKAKLAQTPPMGWRSWNEFHDRITQDIMERTAKAMTIKRDGFGNPTQNGLSLLDLGYDDCGLDDAYQKCHAGVNNTFHDRDGKPVLDTNKFPDMKGMVDYIHGLGLKAGWYLNNCICREKKVPQNGWTEEDHYKGDVDATIEFGFDSVKLDGCGLFLDLNKWRNMYDKTGKSIMIENCHWGKEVPTLDSCPYEMYRTSGDIGAFWGSMWYNLQTTRKFQGDQPLSRPGCWAYPDMMQVGRMKDAIEDRSHFGAWVITSSPLILGHNLFDEKLVNRVWPIIANKRAIEINQDWAGHPGRLVNVSGVVQVWAKPLSGNSIAVFFISNGNRTAGRTSVQVDLETIRKKVTLGDSNEKKAASGDSDGDSDSDSDSDRDRDRDSDRNVSGQKYAVTDVWTGEKLDSVTETVSVVVAGHDSVFYRLDPIEEEEEETMENDIITELLLFTHHG